MKANKEHRTVAVEILGEAIRNVRYLQSRISENEGLEVRDEAFISNLQVRLFLAQRKVESLEQLLITNEIVIDV